MIAVSYTEVDLISGGESQLAIGVHRVLEIYNLLYLPHDLLFRIRRAPGCFQSLLTGGSLSVYPKRDDTLPKAAFARCR